MSGYLHGLATLVLRREPTSPYNRKMRGPQCWKGRSGEEKNLFSLSGFEYRIVNAVTYSLYRLSGTTRKRYVLIKRRVTCVLQSVGTELVVAFPTSPGPAVVLTRPPIRLVTEALF